MWARRVSSYTAGSTAIVLTSCRGGLKNFLWQNILTADLTVNSLWNLLDDYLRTSWRFAQLTSRILAIPGNNHFQQFLSITMCLMSMMYEVHVLRKASIKAETSKTVCLCPSICMRCIVIRVLKTLDTEEYHAGIEVVWSQNNPVPSPTYNSYLSMQQRNDGD